MIILESDYTIIYGGGLKAAELLYKKFNFDGCESLSERRQIIKLGSGPDKSFLDTIH